MNTVAVLLVDTKLADLFLADTFGQSYSFEFEKLNASQMWKSRWSEVQRTKVLKFVA